MTKSTWTGAINSDWANADNWSPAGVPDASSNVVITIGVAVASASIGTVNSITDWSYSDLAFESAGTNTVTTFLYNGGSLSVDDSAGAGGTILNIGGTLTNRRHGGVFESGLLAIGNTALSASDEVTAAALDNRGSIYLTGSSTNQALLDVTGSAGFGAAGVLSGQVQLAGDSAIEFASGEITSLAAGAHLGLNGADAVIEDSTAPGSNTALTGLASIGDNAELDLHNKAAVSTAGALVNDGFLRLDLVDGDGGSSLTVAGALTNSGRLAIGNSALSASDEVTATSLDNTDNSSAIYLTGSSTNQALLDVTTGVAGFGTAGALSGFAYLTGDSAVEFESGEITTLAADAVLSLNGKDAFVEDSSALGSNSALTWLASIDAGASLELEDGASVSTTGTLANDGNLFLDSRSYHGGWSVTGGSDLSVSVKLTVAALDNTGSLLLEGSSANQALIDVTGSAGFGAAGVLSGDVELYDGGAAIEFASGEITTLAADAVLSLNGKDALVEDSAALGSNSALTGLADIAGFLGLYSGAAVSTTGPVTITNSGGLTLDDFSGSEGGGSTLSIGRALTNSGAIYIGNDALSSSDSVTAKSFVNSGTVDLTGGVILAALDVSGATTNDGSISIATDTEEFAGAVGGTGSFSLSSANLQFDSSVSVGQTINETGADALILEHAQSFAATIKGFGTDDTIDAANFLFSGTPTFNFAENSGGTGGTLTLQDGSLTANILMSGNIRTQISPSPGTAGPARW
jgi:hypothetical protein